MIILEGIGVFKDISFGKLLISKQNNNSIIKNKVQDCTKELERYYLAKDTAVKEVRLLYDQALKDFGASEAEIFAVHEMMIKDKDYEDTIVNLINSEKMNAEYAVWETSIKFSELFSNMDDPYMSARALDVKDISDRIINCLSGKKGLDVSEEENVIIFAKDLTPSEVSCLNRNKVNGFVLSEGSVCSHSSIISKVLKIPAVVGVEFAIKPEYNGMNVILDSYSGNVYIDPDVKTIEEFKKKKKDNDEKISLLKALKRKI